MQGGIFTQIGLGQREQCCRRPEPLLLQMDERAGELNEAFVEISVRPVAIGEPELFKHVVGFEKELLVETCEVAKIVGIQVIALIRGDARGDFLALPVHPRSVTAN